MIYEPKVLLIESPYKSDRSTIVDEVKLSDNGLDIIVDSEVRGSDLDFRHLKSSMCTIGC
ncbi:hypothetical protein CPA52_04640 [Pseudoalteromonas marina]|jgi:hypothetical protein|nr:hypothetical protein CPA52_04640 [Pseudoalteromonas marina]